MMLKLLQRVSLPRRLLWHLSTVKDITSILSGVKNPQGISIVDAGIVVNHFTNSNNELEIHLKLDKDYRLIKSIIKEELSKAGVDNVNIQLAPKESSEKFERKSNLKNVKKIIAVSSCKGGVGKSTIAINVAATLKEMGFKVGVFDSDIYGPSLPTLINRENETLQPTESNPKEIEPIDYDGMKTMSFGFVHNKSSIMRGPMVSSVVSQLLYQTAWGELDYLVVDMPPGTGDIQITLCQEVKFDGAVIVTTPQRLAFVDVVKGVQMFQELRVKILGVVENMAYHECVKCNHKDEVFGKGYLAMLVDQFGIKNSIRIPLNSQISKFSDLGSPVVLALPQSHELLKIYQGFARDLVTEAEKPYDVPIVFYNTGQRKIIVETPSKKKVVSPYVLRLKCRCALCIDEFTGQQILNAGKISKEVYPSKIEEKGNYAVAVVWSDGHRSSIYPYERLLGDDIPEEK